MLSRKTVLVVEDELTMRKFIVSVLKQQLNCRTVIQADSADRALETLEQNPPHIDVIISDWEMSGTKGDDFLLRIKMNPALRDAPFIMITCRNDRDAIITAIQAGVTGYIVKPFSTAMLTEKIITALGRQDRRAMPRADARGRKIDVRMTFGAAHSYSGSLVNISQTGLLVRARLFRHGVKGVYEPADLSLQCGDGTLDLPAEIAKMERDSAEFCSLRYMMVGFQFTCLDVANGRKLRSFIEQLGGGAPEPCWGGALNCSLDNDG